MPFRFLDRITRADAAFRAWGPDLEELLAASWRALLRVMVENPRAIRPLQTRTILLERGSAELLLFDLLQELLYLKDAQNLLLRPRRLRVARRAAIFNLEAEAAGEPPDSGRLRLGIDVKAVTLHRFSVEETARGWQATVVLDV